MERKNKLIKLQIGGYVAPSDNTRVVKYLDIGTRLTPQQKERIKQNKLKKVVKKNQSYIYDADKARKYRNMQSFYNNNAFGYGIQGNQTRYDYTTPEGQAAIQSNFNYAKSNVTDFAGNVAGAGIAGAVGTAGRKSAQLYNRLTKGVFKAPSKNGALGTLKQYSKNPIGGGAEAVVVDNTPTTVGKMT